NTRPTIPGSQNWSALHDTNGANTNSHVVAYKIAAGASETTGTFTNATRCVAMVYRGADPTTPVGAAASGGASSSTVSLNALTLQRTNGTSWVAGFAGHRSTNTSVAAGAPTGMQNRVNGEDGTSDAGGYDTTAGVTSWAVQSWAVGGTSSGWRSHTLEVRSHNADATASAQAVGSFTQDADGTALPLYEVAQAWLGVPDTASVYIGATASQSVGGFTQDADAEVIAGNVDAAAAQTVDAFSQAAASEVYVDASLGAAVGDFTQSAAADVRVDASADQTVGDFSTTATAESGAPVEEATARRGGGGVSRGTRRFVVRIDDDEFIVSSASEARALVDQAVALAQESARATAEQLAQREKVRVRAAKRAAPVVRIESPEPVADVPAVNEQIQTMYVDALRTALIAREIQARMEQDEEESLAVLLL
ncbi:MAG: hypothetical protein KAY59_02380, partial [Acidobacteria bacterium]|nr:hypothetical protein [Acidobacteriota bacterium]